MNEPSTLPYRETTRSSFLMGLAAGLLAIALGVAISSSFLLAGVIAATAMIVAWFSSATYEVSERRLSVKIGAGFPHLRIPAESIASVERGSVGAVRSGGLGYRGSWTIGKRVIVSLGAFGGVCSNPGARAIAPAAAPAAFGTIVKETVAPHIARGASFAITSRATSADPAHDGVQRLFRAITAFAAGAESSTRTAWPLAAPVPGKPAAAPASRKCRRITMNANPLIADRLLPAQHARGKS